MLCIFYSNENNTKIDSSLPTGLEPGTPSPGMPCLPHPFLGCPLDSPDMAPGGTEATLSLLGEPGKGGREKDAAPPRSPAEASSPKQQPRRERMPSLQDCFPDLSLKVTISLSFLRIGRKV